MDQLTNALHERSMKILALFLVLGVLILPFLLILTQNSQWQSRVLILYRGGERRRNFRKERRGYADMRLYQNLNQFEKLAFFLGGGGIGCWLPVDEILIRILFLLKDIFESSNIVLREVKKLHCKFVMINKCHDLD